MQRSKKLRSQTKQAEDCISQETVRKHMYMAIHVYTAKVHTKHNVGMW